MTVDKARPSRPTTVASVSISVPSTALTRSPPSTGARLISRPKPRVPSPKRSRRSATLPALTGHHAAPTAPGSTATHSFRVEQSGAVPRLFLQRGPHDGCPLRQFASERRSQPADPLSAGLRRESRPALLRGRTRRRDSTFARIAAIALVARWPTELGGAVPLDARRPRQPQGARAPDLHELDAPG
jgi:hypothetical protein